jgi:hypothetical protein
MCGGRGYDGAARCHVLEAALQLAAFSRENRSKYAVFCAKQGKTLPVRLNQKQRPRGAPLLLGWAGHESERRNNRWRCGQTTKFTR